jgi:transcriptional regulator with XRE-family HTH domain
MGAASLEAKRLGEKLLQIRNAFGLSQSEMLRRLGFEDVLVYNRISDYELGKREPPLPVLLQYARLIRISTDLLIDDNLDLPANLETRRK